MAAEDHNLTKKDFSDIVFEPDLSVLVFFSIFNKFFSIWNTEFYFQSKKRENYLDWHEYFIAVSVLSSFRSKDPNSQVIVYFGDFAFCSNLIVKSWR